MDTCADVGGRLPMYKLKDWPTEDDFHNKLPRHFADFVQMIPFQVSLRHERCSDDPCAPKLPSCSPPRTAVELAPRAPQTPFKPVLYFPAVG